MRRIARRVLGSLLVLCGASCGGSGSDAGTTAPPPVASIASVDVSLGASALTVGATTTAAATLRTATGSIVSGKTVSWSSSTPTVASIDGSGTVTALSAGTATITATADGRSGSEVVTVTPVPVASISLSLAATSIVASTSVQATAVARDAAGAALSGRQITWTTSASQIATVSQTGLVQGLAPGTATITATSEGRSASATITVTQPPVASVVVSLASTTLTPGRTTQATALIRDASGATLSGRTLTWSSTNESVAVVSASGVVTAIGVGSASITATSEGVTGSVALAVGPASVASVQVTPGTSTLAVGQSTALQATLRDDLQNVLTGRTVAWTTSNATIAQVSSSGVLTGVSSGSATITATSEGKSATAAITVTVAAVASVILSANSFSMLAGDFRTLIATYRDAQGNVLTGRSVSWFSSNLSVVDGQVFGDTAVITGLTAGAAVVTANVEGRQASITVTVLAPTTNVCTAIAGASIIANDGKYLGRFTNRFDSESVLNQFGQYGSPYAALSTNNQYGTYGSPYSSLSARNPYTSTPPVIVKNGTALAYYTVNATKTPSVAPAYALTCTFP